MQILQFFALKTAYFRFLQQFNIHWIQATMKFQPRLVASIYGSNSSF